MLSPADAPSFLERPSHILLTLIMLTSFAVAYYPVMKSLAATWMTSDNYSHGFFIPFLFIYIIWLKREKICQKDTVSPHWAGLVIVIVSLLSYLFASYAEIQTLASLSMVACLAGATLYLLGFSFVRELVFPFFLLLFMIPVPSQLYAKITIPLQLFVTKISALIAQLAGIPVFRAGNIIETPGLSLQVVEACSGMRSMITLLLLSSLFAFFTLQSRTGRVVLFFSGIPVAILINIFRVSGIFLAWQFFKYDLTHGLWHTVLGIMLFCIALICLFGLQKGIVLWERKALSG